MWCSCISLKTEKTKLGVKTSFALLETSWGLWRSAENSIVFTLTKEKIKLQNFPFIVMNFNGKKYIFMEYSFVS
jgi:hypothetical protein